jgi:uncharacterized membrane protein
MSDQGAKTGTGLAPNVAGLLCYVLGWVTGIIFLILEKQDKSVRFHAMQSIVVFGAYTIVALVFGWIPFIGWIISPILGVIAFILWILLMVKAYQGQQWKVPFAGNFAESLLKSGSGTKSA